HVERVMYDVDRRVGEFQLHADIRIAAREQGHRGGDIGTAETQRRVDLEQPARLRLAAGDELVQVLDVAEYAACIVQVQLALGCQADALRTAIDQAHAQAVLDLRRALADRRGGHAHLARGRR